MAAISNEALEWMDRAEQAREVAGQLTDPGARQAVLQLADSYDRLARAAAAPTTARRRELARQDQESNSGADQSRPYDSLEFIRDRRVPEICSSDAPRSTSSRVQSRYAVSRGSPRMSRISLSHRSRSDIFASLPDFQGSDGGFVGSLKSSYGGDRLPLGSCLKLKSRLAYG